ncbi:DUF2269 family protein [Paenibacillus sp. LMG 31456]|uniref:DUF2269 family protein n=1 Tax=Paenibacillus foliorum TaxID=2654974 RepID=A0A972GUX5_9BACL|nr:DUF2269 family protein [Paenibacillus foliorum]NOU94668.1 DUF2269 family protein [Paenibacillus foliorum]
MKFLLFLHVLGAILLVGNIFTAAFWKVKADIKGDLAAIHSATKNVMLADYIFTIPGLILIIVTGSLMALKAGYSMSGFNWLTLSLTLFSLTGLIWLALLLPLQRSMIRHSAQSLEAGTLSKAYRKASLYWAIFGTIGTLIPVVVLYLMISKPM